MSNLNLQLANGNSQSFSELGLEIDLEQSNRLLEAKTAIERIEWAFRQLPGTFALSSSFGIQSAVSLHMLTQIMPDIPVVVIDTCYLFSETYQFIDRLSEKLSLNIKIYRPELSNAWQEARYGKLWQQGIDGLARYNKINKVDPMEAALSDLNIKNWFAGLMRSQSQSRSELNTLQKIRGRIKVHPLIDWDKRMVHQYLQKHDLPYHPLWEKGYVSVGDTHSSIPLGAGMRDEDTRHGGIKRECGLHEDTLSGL